MKIISGGGVGSVDVFFFWLQRFIIYFFFSLVNIGVHPMLLFSRHISLFHSLIVGFLPKMNE